MSKAATSARYSPGWAEPFCVLSMQRSGTTLLLDLLDSHPSLRCDNGILLTDPRRRRPSEAGSPGRGGSLHRFGFKIIDSLNLHWLPVVLQDPGVPVILLTRADGVRHYYSCEAAQRSGIYHHRTISETLRTRAIHFCRSAVLLQWKAMVFNLRSFLQTLWRSLWGTQDYRPSPLHLDPAGLDAFIAEKNDRFERFRRALRDRGGPWLEIRYEDLREPARAETMARVLAFLGLPPAPLTTSVRPLNDRPLEDLVSNHQEILAHGRRTGLVIDAAPSAPSSLS